MNIYASCNLCPRRCGAARSKGRVGFCGETEELRLACASIHFGEEPSVTGKGGSGAIFVSGCNLGCVFCQNFQISRIPPGKLPTETGRTLGRAVGPEEFAEICLALEKRGAENINIVTGSHAVPAIAEGLRLAKSGHTCSGKTGAAGLSIPVLWNSSAYELPETLELLAGLVDAFLPDMKTLDSALAARCFRAPDYPEVARTAIQKMIGLAEKSRNRSGLPALIVRHLVLPGHADSTKSVLRWFAEHYSGRKGVELSLMFQYTGIRQNPLTDFPSRSVSEEEYNAVLLWLDEYGIEDGYCQELVPATTDWLPDFEKDNPFPSDLSIPVWHWRNGFLQPLLNLKP
jgi:putative pyruvate formate lyase activating enzyme